MNRVDSAAVFKSAEHDHLIFPHACRVLVSGCRLGPSRQNFVPRVRNAVENEHLIVRFLIRHDATVQVRLLTIDYICMMSDWSRVVNPALVSDWNPRSNNTGSFLHVSCLSGSFTTFEEREIQIAHLANDPLSDVETTVNVHPKQQSTHSVNVETYLSSIIKLEWYARLSGKRPGSLSSYQLLSCLFVSLSTVSTRSPSIIFATVSIDFALL